MCLLVLLLALLLAFGGLPRWGYQQYGYGPSSLLGVALVVCLVLFFLGRL